MRTIAVLPVKSFGIAKSRLGTALDRPALAEAMVADVLAALARVAGLDEVIVVAAAGTFTGARRIDEPAVPGHPAAAAHGAREAVRAGAERVLMVPGDCPALDPGEVEALLSAGGAAPSLTIVPDRHGTGTNALLLCPPLVIDPAFGAGSFARHRALGHAAGAAVTLARPPSLLLDVDTPDDLDALLTTAPAAAAPRTRALGERRAA